MPCTVVVERVVFDKWDGCMSRALMTQGSTNVILAWSSMIARPSIDMLVSGCLSITGHVLLKDLVRNMVAGLAKVGWFFDCQSRLGDEEMVSKGRQCRNS